MATTMKRTNVYLSEQDRADAEYIREEMGLTSVTSAIRWAVRRAARQLQGESVRDQPKRRTRAAQGDTTA